jgi:hypothetical protein
MKPVMTTVDRFAGESLPQIVGRFLAMEPRPEGISSADWASVQAATKGLILGILQNDLALAGSAMPGRDPVRTIAPLAEAVAP